MKQLFYGMTIFSLGWFAAWVQFKVIPSPQTSRHWWTPSAWASVILFEVAKRMPNDMDMLVGAAYGVVEVCGLRRASKPLFAMLKAKFARKHAAN